MIGRPASAVLLFALLAAAGAAASPETGAAVEVPRVDDPRTDGWSTEALSTAVGSQLHALGDLLERDAITAADLEPLVEPEATTTALVPQHPPRRVFAGRGLEVVRGEIPAAVAERGTEGLARALRQFADAVGGDHRKAKLKLVGISVEDGSVAGRVLVWLKRYGAVESGEEHAVWTTRWTPGGGDRPPRLVSVAASEWERATFRGGTSPTLFTDCTVSVLSGVEAFETQLLRGTTYWLTALEASLGTDLMGHSGLAVADVDGDGLEDVYLAQGGGLPNLLLLQEPDGTVRDASRSSGTDWLDRSHGPLFADLDDDGDPDLAVATAAGLILMENDGTGRFAVRQVATETTYAYSLAAADYDLDGDLDLYATRYSPVRGDPVDETVDVPHPIPYHDAENGAPNHLLRNDGDWRFTDATAETGLDADNRRWSFAAAWADYDDDGDPDLYVANDFGRNCLYRNDGGRFVNVAREAGVEDAASGMSVDWADVDHDGRLDLYVGNMFSSAGNRITTQERFQPAASAAEKGDFRRFARGNSLYLNRGDGTFEDATTTAGVAMGRWAWSSVFSDFDNDGRDDLFVANGFLTAEDTSDL